MKPSFELCAQSRLHEIDITERPRRIGVNPGMAQSSIVDRLMADLVLLLHFAFVLFAVFGAFLAILDPRLAWVHIPAVLWSAVVNLASWTCPLTPLEKTYRSRAGSSYQGGFIQHYVGSMVYPRGMPRRMELIAGFSIVAWNSVVYAALVSLARTGQAS